MSTNAERIIQIVTPLTDVVNLMVLGCSLDDANLYAQTLRNSGMAVHLIIANTPDDLDEILQQPAIDIVLVNIDAEEIDFTTAIRQIREVSPLASFILLSDSPDDELFFAAETRAHDIIKRHDHAHLIYAVNREQQNMIIAQKLLSLEKELKETQGRCKTLTESATEAIAYVHQGMHVYANPAYLSLFGFHNSDDLEGLPFMDLIASDDRLKFKPVLRKLDQDHTAEKIKINCLSNDGRIMPVTMHFAPTTIDGEQCTQVIVHDHSQQLDVQQRLAELANYDTDTGLYNRKYLIEQLEQRLPMAQESHQRLSLILINITNFLDIKADAGIHHSELLLKEASRRLDETTYESDLLARFGEHELALLCTPETNAESLAKRLLSSLTEHLFKAEELQDLPHPEFVIGIAYSDEPPVQSTPDFINHATRAWKKALDSTTHIAVYDDLLPEPAAETETDANLVHLIDEALEHDRFRAVYQPVVSLHGNSREDYVVYLRLLNDHNEVMMPDGFLAEAVRAERMTDIDRWVIRTTIREVASYRNDGQRLNFMINLSADGITDDSLLLWICDCLREFKAKGAWLTFVVSQHDVMCHLDKMEQLAEGLRQINCRIAVSHFPLEQEAVNLVKHLSTDIVFFEPDASSKITRDKEQRELLTSFNQQLQKEGVKTVVTHVEEAAQLAVLWNVGVDFIQGNFIQEPVDSIVYDAEL